MNPSSLPHIDEANQQINLPIGVLGPTMSAIQLGLVSALALQPTSFPLAGGLESQYLQSELGKIRGYVTVFHIYFLEHTDIHSAIEGLSTFVVAGCEEDSDLPAVLLEDNEARFVAVGPQRPPAVSEGQLIIHLASQPGAVAFEALKLAGRHILTQL